MSETTDELEAVQAKHQPFGPTVLNCEACERDADATVAWPCLPFRLAEAWDAEVTFLLQVVAAWQARAEAAEAEMAQAERRGAAKALRNLPDHLKPNMSLVAQTDRLADAVENGGSLFWDGVETGDL
jgi:hypothetical protein